MNAWRMISLMVGHWFRTPAQGVPRDLVHLTVAAGDGADDGRQAGQMRDVAGELSLAMDRDRLRLVAGVVHDLDLARLHDEEVHVAVANRKQLLPVPKQLRLGMGARRQVTDLRLIQSRECHRLKVLFIHKGKLNSLYSHCRLPIPASFATNRNLHRHA